MWHVVPPCFGGRYVLLVLLVLFLFPLARVTAQSGTDPRVGLTPAEKAWIADHPVLRAAATPDWPPFDYVDADGEYRGIDADLLRRLATMAGFEIEAVSAPWPELYRMLREGELDVCAGMQASEERRKHLLFTDPVFRFPHAIYLRKGTSGV